MHLKTNRCPLLLIIANPYYKCPYSKLPIT